MGKPNINEDLRLLVLEPYAGGSHAAWLKQIRRLPFGRIEVMELPARKWKWRMRLAAPHFAQELRRSGEKFDRVLCSSMLDVAALRGLGPAWLNDVPVLTYFHENQFAYPVRADDHRDVHFGLTNLTTALASDSLAFNSEHNLSSFLAGAAEALRHSGETHFEFNAEEIRSKARVLGPGVDFTAMDAAPEPPRHGPPAILWNHRWEHDKDPETFFNALFELDAMGASFNLIVMGQSHRDSPAVFASAGQRLAGRIQRMGYATSRSEYAIWLRRAAVVVSTARHEFFGMSVMEAVRAGARPLLPGRLSYPELFPAKYLYGNDELVPALRDALRAGRLRPHESRRLTEPHSWHTLKPAYTQWIGATGPLSHATLTE